MAYQVGSYTERIAKTVKTQVRQYAKETTVNTFICDMQTICNNAGYYADDPKETKKFWLTFTLDCISQKDYQFLCSLANFIFNQRVGIVVNRKYQ